MQDYKLWERENAREAQNSNKADLPDDKLP